MPQNPRRKSDAARRANQIVRSRTALIMLILGVVTFGVLFWRLYDLQILRHDELQGKAVEQQTRSAVVNASRGTIYDSSLNTLAISATAEDVNISPKGIAEFVESQKESQEKAAQKAADKGETYTAPVLRDQTYIAKGLSRILGVEQETLEARMTKTSYEYWNIKKQAEQNIADEVRRFINGEIDPDGNEVPKEDQVKLQGSGSSPPPSGIIFTAPWPPVCWALSMTRMRAAWAWKQNMTTPLPALPVIPSVPEMPPAPPCCIPMNSITMRKTATTWC